MDTNTPPILQEREEMQAMLGENPGFMVRNGLLILGAIVLLLLSLAWFVEYPDIVAAPVTVTAAQPAIRLLAPSDGKLESVSCADQELVEVGMPLALLESGVAQPDAQRALDFLNALDAAKTPSQLAVLVVPPEMQLGQLQATWSQLTNEVFSIQKRLAENIVFQQIKSIDAEIAALRNLIESLQRQEALLREDLSLTKKNLDRQRALESQHLLSSQDLEQYESAYLKQQQTLENFSSNIGTQQVRIRQLETRQTELTHGRIQELDQFWERIRQQSQNMRSALQDWELQHRVKAPFAGKVEFASAWAPQQFVRREQLLFTLVSSDTTQASNMAFAQLPVANAGKVTAGQTVKIWLDAYPFQEYGALEGKVVSVAATPSENAYLVRIQLTNGLQTTVGKEIPFKPELSGTAKIITREYSVLQRIFQRFEQLRRS